MTEKEVYEDIEKKFNEYVCILNKCKQLEKELKQTKLNFKNSQTHSKNCYKKLKEKFERVKEVYHRNYELIQENGKLKQENQELKEKNLKLSIENHNYKIVEEMNKTVVENKNKQLLQATELNITYLDKIIMLKKAIKILKDKIEFEDLGEMQSGNVYRGYFNDCLDEEEVNSLKEVLEDE